jgi:pyruvate-ferredoxin/flavodoxin oxidoreductase
MPLKDYVYRENRFKVLTKSRPKEAAVLLEQAQKDVHDRWRAYKAMASIGSE